MEFQTKLEFRGQSITKNGSNAYYFENENGKGFTIYSKTNYKLEKGAKYVLILSTNSVFLNDIKGV